MARFNVLSTLWIMLCFNKHLFTTVLASLNSNMTESQMIQELLDPSRYDKLERPNRYTGLLDKYVNGFTSFLCVCFYSFIAFCCYFSGKPVDVEISVFVNSVSDVSAISMQLSVDLFLRLMWTDPRLNFESNPDFQQEITLHESVRHQIWSPDIYIRNELKTGNLHTLMTPNVMLTLDPTGYIFFSQRISTKLFCMMHLKTFPMDRQKCFMEFESYSYSTADVKLNWRDRPGAAPIDIRENLTLPEFNLTGSDSGDCTTYYTVGNGTGSWNCVYFTISLKRLFEYYLIQVYVPSMMVVVLSWLSFWIDTDAVPARISLGLLTVLTITTQASGISSQLPKVSYIKALDVWMFTCTVFVFGALIEYSAVNVLSRRDKARAALKKHADLKQTDSKSTEFHSNGIPPDPYGTKPTGFFSLPSVFNLDQDHAPPEENEEKQTISRGCCVKFRLNNALKVDIISRILFPTTFVGFNAFYWFYYYTKSTTEVN